MKIAQIAPLAERCPPRLYGGTERIVSYLTEELVRQGHEVTLFASGDSKTAARLVRCSDMALRLNPEVKDHTPYHVIMLDQVRQHADDFDVMHFHIDMMHFPLIRDFADRTVTTLHGRLDLPDLKPFHAAFPEIPLVSISRDCVPAGTAGRGSWYDCLQAIDLVVPARTSCPPIYLVDLRGHLLLARYILHEHILAVAVVCRLTTDI